MKINHCADIAAANFSSVCNCVVMLESNPIVARRETLVQRAEKRVGHKCKGGMFNKGANTQCPPEGSYLRGPI